MRPSNEQRIEALRSRRAQIDAELARLQAKARVLARKEDTRRKILIGAIMMQEMASRPDFDRYVRSLLFDRLEKPRDRALFGFSAGPEPTQP